MYGRMPSSSSSRPFSAADAYAQVEQDLRQDSTPATEASAEVVEGPRSQGHPLSSWHTGAGRGATSSDAMAKQDAESDEEDDGDDWDVYDDFNNVRPPMMSKGHSQGSMSTGGQDYLQRLSYARSNAGLLTPGTPTSMRLPAMSSRGSTLLDPNSFGFDVQHGNPRERPEEDPEYYSTAPRHAHSQEPLAVSGRSISGLEGISKRHSSAGVEEEFTTPALGQDWTQDELTQMTKPYKRHQKMQKRKRAVKSWSEGETKICGWLSPRALAFILFFSFALLGVLLYFVIPRVPTLAFLTTTPLTAVPDASGLTIDWNPTSFSMTMDLNLRADNRGSWIPTQVRKMDVLVIEETSSKRIGAGTLYSQSFAGRSQKVFSFPVDFSYISVNTSGDTTFLQIYNACGHKYTNTNRPNLNLGIEVTMNIIGLVGSKKTTTKINTACPFELSSST